ncbi:hypothetical protein ACQWHL_27395, partial [Salmonella enterica subsp. enterica serovar Infantis]
RLPWRSAYRAALVPDKERVFRQLFIIVNLIFSPPTVIPQKEAVSGTHKQQRIEPEIVLINQIKDTTHIQVEH